MGCTLVFVNLLLSFLRPWHLRSPLHLRGAFAFCCTASIGCETQHGSIIVSRHSYQRIMSTGRSRRLPISCEPCRIRKIRCPRDAAPCGSCRRRGVSAAACQYAKRTPAMRPRSPPPSTMTQALPSPHTDTPSLDVASPESADLASRVRKLEQLLLAVSPHTNARPGASNNVVGESWAMPSINVSSRERASPRDILLGSLRATEAGHLRFFPQALSWGPDLHDFDDETQKSAIPSQPSRPLGNRRSLSVQELLVALPPQRACQELVDVYFQSFASLFHILHDPTFRRQYAFFLEDPHSMPLSWIGLLYSILSTAVLALPPDSALLSDLSRQASPLAQSVELTQRYRDMAMRSLEADNFMWDHNVTTLQALIILIYGLSHSHGQTWTLLGLAHHLALSIGCHVDPDTLGLDLIEKEERRRAWAGLMMLYTNQNAALGHIGLPHTVLPASSKPPADVNDDDITQDILEPNNSTGEATQMTYLLLKFRLYDICADICANVLSKETPDLDYIRSMDDTIQNERRTWDYRLTQAIETVPLRVHHIAHLQILHSYANHLTMLLHQRQALDSRCPSSVQYRARSRCLESAKHLLQIHATLNETPEMTPFRWYGRGVGSFHAFHAAALMAHLLHSIPVGEESEQYINLLQGCLSRFNSLADYSTVCAKAAPVVQVLLSVYVPYSSPHAMFDPLTFPTAAIY